MAVRLQPVKEEMVDSLSVRVYRKRDETGTAAGEAAAARMKELLAQKERVRVIFAAAPSQNEMLDALASDRAIEWPRVTAFHMDEYIGLPDGAPQAFGQYLRDRLFDRVRPGRVHYIDGKNEIREECRRYEALLSEAPIDIVCLGIGENGHIAFNDPPVADFNDPLLIKPVELDEVCRQQQVNDGCFDSFDEVPTHALTLTIPALLSGAHLICVVPGERKRQAVARTLRGPVSPDCPSSSLRTHPDCLLFLDEASFPVTER
jgi:glucosamine-6-phosphate deaminase